jgi:hypothetical protein
MHTKIMFLGMLATTAIAVPLVEERQAQACGLESNGSPGANECFVLSGNCGDLQQCLDNCCPNGACDLNCANSFVVCVDSGRFGLRRCG